MKYYLFETKLQQVTVTACSRC